jgi:hypothetical protein
VIGPAVLGTLALHGADAIERKLLGRRPVYDVAAMGKRLFGRAWAGVALRWLYGPALALVQAKLSIPPLVFGPAIALAELIAMPRVGATPSPGKWRREEVVLLFAHSTAFALAVHATHRFAGRARRRRGQGSAAVPFGARCG